MIAALSSLIDTNNFRALAGPILIIMILAMMVLPLPPFVLDLLFTFNIAVSIIVLMVSLYTRNPLDFAVFPTILLIATLLGYHQYCFNRVVLLKGIPVPWLARQSKLSVIF
jgi:flagellar biosynthesis protein FlhA